MNKLCKHCQSNSYDQDFCCTGCKTAYKIINNLGFQDYYKLRTADDNGQTKPREDDEIIDIKNFAKTNNDGSFEIDLLIQGLHCAACIWLIENILNKNPDVIKNRVNLTQKTIFIKWKGNLDKFYDITKIIQKIGYKLLPIDQEIIKKNQTQEDRSLLFALAIAGFGAGNLMLFSVGLWFASSQEMGFQTRNLLHFFSALIALPVIIFAGRPFFKSALTSIKIGYPNMDLVISVAIILTAIASLIKTFRGAEHIYFDSAVMLIFFLLIGRFLESKVKKKAFSVANEFSLINSSFGRVEIDNKIKIIASKDLKKDMILIIASGEKIVADGEIIEGESEIDYSLINGESQPRSVRIGSKVFAGTHNINSPIKIRITTQPQESLLSKIIKLTEQINDNKNKYIKTADRLAKLYIPVSHGLAFLTFAIWYFYFKADIDTAFSNSVAVLIITCPCALALAVPVAQTIMTSQMLKLGVIIKSGVIIEKIGEIKHIIFDKTGSLTVGKPVLTEIIKIGDNNKNNDELIKIAASLCKNSRHPLSQAILNYYNGDLINIITQEIKGHGLKGQFNGKEVLIGKASFCKINDNNKKINNDNNLITYLTYDENILKFSFSDAIKEDASEIIDYLKNKDYQITLLSGDIKENVTKIAKKLKINNFYYEKTPIDKVNFLKDLHKDNKKFIMVGDGINDAPALQTADISISFNNASDIAQNISDVIIQGQKLTPIIQLISSSQYSIKIIKQNIAISLIYNSVAIPFAMAGFVVPLIAALAMSSSSILVLLNSMRIQKIVKNQIIDLSSKIPKI